MISIRLAAQPVNMTIIQIYALTSDYDNEDIKIFYEEIEKTMTETNKKDILIIQGDWNSIVGNSNKEWNNAVDKFALGLIQEALDFSNLLLSIILHLLILSIHKKTQEKLLGTLQMVTHIIK